MVSCGGGAGSSGGPAPQMVDVTFDQNYDDAPAPAVMKIEKGKSFGSQLPTAARTGTAFIFGGWATTKTAAEANFTATTAVSEALTVYAIWYTTVPALVDLTSASYEVGTTENVSIRVTVGNATLIGATNLSYQWYKADSADGNGTAIGNAITGNTGRDYTPPVDVAGTIWYWVVVTNTTTNESATSTRARIIVYVPSGDTAVEKIIVANAAMPLWEFTLPDGADWEEYEQFSIQYYVSKFSRITQAGQNIRSRLYGAYVAGDFVTPDQGNANGWGSNGTEPNPGAFRMVSFNTNPMTNTERTGLNANPNNDFILDNSKGSDGLFSARFTVENGAPSTWFTVRYTTNAGLAKDFAKVTGLDSDTVETIYVGAGIFGPGGDSTSNSYEFYVKNPTLINKNDPTKNIVGNPTKTGTTEQLFAGNLGSPKGATTRSVLSAGDDSYLDVDGAIKVYFDLAGGSGSFPTLDLMEGDKLPASFFATTPPTRDGFDFDGWYIGDDEVDANTEFTEITTVTAKWQRLSVLNTYRVDLNGQTYKNTTAWNTNNNNGFVIKLGDDFDSTLYDTVKIKAKFYESDGTTVFTDVENGNFQMKYYATEPATANTSGQLETGWNFGQTVAGTGGGINSVINADDTVTVTYTPSATTKSGNYKYVAIQTSNGTLTAQYVEILSIWFPGEAEGTPWIVNLNGQTLRNTAAWTSGYSNGIVIALGNDFDSTLYDTIKIKAKFYESDGTTVVTDVENGNFQMKYYATEPANANAGGALDTAYNFGQTVAGSGGGINSVINDDDTVTVTFTPGAAIKNGNYKYVAIQSSNGTLTAQYVEILSVWMTYTP
jgi:uncharacterized repeat protein (TIGR02543 family)